MFLINRDVERGARALYEGRWITYGELRATVSALAGELAGPAKRLIFCFAADNAATVFAYLAAIESGNSVAMLDAGLPPELKAPLVECYSPELIVSHSADVDPGIGGGDRVFAHRESAGGVHIWERPPAESHRFLHPSLCLLLSTSGSTGSPKFVRLTRANVERNAESICDGLAICGEDIAISTLPFHYSYGLSVLNTHLVRGAGVVLTDRSLMAKEFWQTLRDTQATSFAGVPYTYSILKRLKLEELSVPSLHTLTQAGGKLHNDLVEHFNKLMQERGGRFFVMYGQTEATARIAILPHERLPEKTGSAGKVIKGGKLSVVDGELVYNGPNVMMGYANDRTDLHLGDVLGGTLHTGDMGQIDDDGFVYVTGRTCREAKVLGLRFNLDEIESMLKGRGPTAVITSGDRFVIYCEYGTAQDYQRYSLDLARTLKVNYRVFDFRYIDSLPLNANGKPDYQKLRSLA